MTSCQNCGAALRGPYCAVCGQRHDPHVHSIGHFAAEAAETLTHADSRLWRTLGALMLRPGRLTVDFFEGRRASQLPPFRLYLIVSVAFFLLASLLPSEPALQLDAARPVAGTRPSGACEELEVRGLGRAGEWLQPRLGAACARVQADGGRSVTARIWATLPRAMFVLLPLMAALMLLLYWRPRRRYVEHLLLFVHNHTAAFAAIGLQLAAGTVLPKPAAAPLSAAVAGYLGWYFYRSMRVYYGQGRGLTLAKYVTILVLYGSMAALVLSATFLYAFLAA